MTDTQVQRCRECGCTNDKACPGGCSWIEQDLCSTCAEPIDGDTVMEVGHWIQSFMQVVVDERDPGRYHLLCHAGGDEHCLGHQNNMSLSNLVHEATEHFRLHIENTADQGPMVSDVELPSHAALRLAGLL